MRCWQPELPAVCVNETKCRGPPPSLNAHVAGFYAAAPQVLLRRAAKCVSVAGACRRSFGCRQGHAQHARRVAFLSLSVHRRFVSIVLLPLVCCGTACSGLSRTHVCIKAGGQHPSTHGQCHLCFRHCCSIQMHVLLIIRASAQATVGWVWVFNSDFLACVVYVACVLPKARA